MRSLGTDSFHDENTNMYGVTWGIYLFIFFLLLKSSGNIGKCGYGTHQHQRQVAFANMSGYSGKIQFGRKN